MRLSRLAVPVVAAALLVTSLAGPASAADSGAHQLRAHVGSGRLHASADAPNDVVIDSIGCYLNNGTGTIVGDVRNLTDVPVRDIEVTVRVEDGTGHVRATGTGRPWFEFVDPGEYASFRVDVTNATGATDCYASVSDYSGTIIPANQYFTASNVSTTGWSDAITRLSGRLANNNTVSASEITLVATLYTTDGRVVGTNVQSLSGTMTPGNTTSFMIDVEHEGSGVPDYYRIQAESTSDPQTATTMDAAQNEIVYGSSTDITGRGVPGNPVRVQEWDQPSASWMDLEGDLITADNSGNYSLQLSPDWSTTYRTISGSVTSVPVVLFVDAHVTMKSSAKKTTVGKKVVLSGIAEPLDSGSRVVIQRKSGSSWKTVATVAASASGAWKYTWKPTAKGTYVLRAWVDDQTHVFSGNSSSVTIAVK